MNTCIYVYEITKNCFVCLNCPGDALYLSRYTTSKKEKTQGVISVREKLSQTVLVYRKSEVLFSSILCVIQIVFILP